MIDKPAEQKEHSHALHAQAKKKFAFQQVEGELIGFFSQKHEGVFTHRGEFIHVHFIDAENAVMGHLDDLTLEGEVQFLLPAFE